MIRARFTSNSDDARPINWPVKHPFWFTGYGENNTTIVAYVDNMSELLANWPEAENIDYEEAEEYVFSSRFVCPTWFNLRKDE